MVERWIEAGYTVLVIDPEGDHIGLGHLPKTVVVDASLSQSSDELQQLLRLQSLSIVVDLSRLAPDQMRGYLQDLAASVEAIRSTHGLPHWVIVDEAHGAMRESGPLANVFRPMSGGYCYVTYLPDQLCNAAKNTIDLILTTSGHSTRAPEQEGSASISRNGGEQVVFQLDDRATSHARHAHKYATAPLPRHHQFAFREPSGQVITTAVSLHGFARELCQAPDRSIHHHAENGDFSRWVLETLQDRDLAVTISQAEQDFIAELSASAQVFRSRLLRELRRRFEADAE
jgi:hypothetical protein